MVATLYYLFKATRPRQWLKNLTVYTAITFTGQLFNPQKIFLTTKAFIVLTLISSASYLINDIFDQKSDQSHPFKKHRPIAKGLIKTSLAAAAAALFILSALLWSASISWAFFSSIASFLLLQLAYTLILKHIAILDILTIAAAFVIRIFAGEIITGFFITVWLRLAIVSIALFLAVGKRRAELTLLQQTKTIPSITRLTLGRYTEKLLDVYTAMFANATWITYSFYTFLERPPTLRLALGPTLADFASDLQERKWLMATIPFVLFGIMRYMQLIYEKAQGESPERLITTDLPLLLNIALWGLSVLFIIYGLGR